MYQTFTRRISSVVYGNRGGVNAKHVSGFSVKDGVVHITLANGGDLIIHEFPEDVADDDAVCVVADAVHDALNGYLVPIPDRPECEEEE